MTNLPVHDSYNDVDYRTQRHLHFDRAAGEAILDNIDPDGVMKRSHSILVMIQYGPAII